MTAPRNTRVEWCATCERDLAATTQIRFCYRCETWIAAGDTLYVPLTPSCQLPQLGVSAKSGFPE